MKVKQNVELPEPILTVRGEFGDGLADLVTWRLATIARHAHEPVLAIHVELDRNGDPSVANPVTARLSIDFNGRPVRATAAGRTARDAVDQAVTRLTRQMDDRPHAHRRGRQRR